MSDLNNTLLYESEKQHMDKVYGEFDARRKVVADKVDMCAQYATSGSYDDHHAFMAYSDLSDAKKKRHETEALIQLLYNKPYFAHIEASVDGEEPEHYYLSDCDALDSSLNIEGAGLLIPFKLDQARPVSKALYHCYVARDGKPTKYSVPLKYGQVNNLTITPSLICDDEIFAKELLDIALLFSSEPGSTMDADELLSQILDQNRNNPALRNIISTLQQKQFEIIAADTKQSFVVQGCAGSGKSQCVLHRLFFLRDELSQQGWEKVMLITPTQLFRNYSVDLIKRYRLGGISNCSISELYFDLLHSYDPRFKNRQYVIRLSEEYLPDQYLNEIYSENVIIRIDTEIKNSIKKYISAACKALGVSIPDSIETETINKLLEVLREAIARQDQIDDELADNPSYQAAKTERETLLKQVKDINRRLQKLDADIQSSKEEIDKLQALIDARNDAYFERQEWMRQRELRISSAREELGEATKQVDVDGDILSVVKYADALFLLNSITSGELYVSDEEYLAFLDEYCSQAEKDLKDYAKKGKPETLVDRNRSKLISVESERSELILRLNDVNARLELCELSIRRITEAFEGEQNQRTLNKAELERAEYYLSRIETTVFEQEIWNVLMEIKQKYAIEYLEIEKIDDAHRRETKILYKSDLLFYVKLYSQLYPKTKLPEYKLFCIDEAQDLHKADYDILRKLYPNALFNVFGDLDQVLHTSCGVSNWEADTGIQTVYSLNRNYRNTAATVEFCNRHFGSSMQGIGKEKEEEKPKVITDIDQLRKAINEDTVVIVRDYECFEEFCRMIGVQYQFEYLDTNAKGPNPEKISCYSIFAAKGLEFSHVVVYAKNMTKIKRWLPAPERWRDCSITSKIISNREKLSSVSAKLIFPLTEIREALVKQTVLDRELLNSAVAVLDEYLGCYHEVLQENAECSLIYSDVEKTASKTVLKQLVASGGYLSTLSDIGRHLLVDKNALSSYAEENIQFLIENGLLMQISVSTVKKIDKWTLTTRAWKVVNNSSTLPDYRIPIKNAMLPNEWTVKTYCRIEAITNFMTDKKPYLIAFANEEKTIPYACTISDPSAEASIILSVAGRFTPTEAKEVKNAFIGNAMFDVVCLFSNVDSGNISTISDGVSTPNWEFIEWAKEEVTPDE